VAPFATVCREWQVLFETCTFRRLVLSDAASLGEFDAIIRHNETRLGYIRKLWLRVHLVKYECPDCDEPEDEGTQRWYVLTHSYSYSNSYSDTGVCIYLGTLIN
jgi:hypothetical protein